MKKLEDGVEFFDGKPVEIYEGRFSGGFQISEFDGPDISYGDQVTFLVTARVQTPKFSTERRTGQLKRLNTMKVEDVQPLSRDRAKYLLDQMGASVVGVNDGVLEQAEDHHDDPESFIRESFKEIPSEIGFNDMAQRSLYDSFVGASRD